MKRCGGRRVTSRRSVIPPANMKTQRLLIAAALIGAALSLPAVSFAQPARADRGDRPMHREMRDRMGEKVAEKLQLTDAQKQQMKALREQHEAAMKALRAESEGARKQNREKAQALQKQFRDQRRALLTPEQLKIADEMEAKMKEHRQERAEHRAERRGGHRGHGPAHDTPPPPKTE
ncbi:MAG: hypothetical protein C0518_01265 [Opitutus sp.]|nr:hypothetical protein [Opitutus sp.]